MLGNPPWEKLQTEELQFFASRDPTIAALKGSKRKAAIVALEQTNSLLAAEWESQKRTDAATIGFIRNAGVFPLTGVGKFNSFALFAELNSKLVSPTGHVGCIIPSGIATDDTTKFFFQNLMKTRSLVSLYDFENREGIFPGVHRSYKFCLLTLAGLARPATRGATFVFFAHTIEQLRDENRRFMLTIDDLVLSNPNTLTRPIFRFKRDAELTKTIYRRVPIFLNEQNPSNNEYKPKVRRLLNTTDDSSRFLDINAEPDIKDLIPVIEAKTIHQFDHRFATFQKYGERSAEIAEVTDAQKANPKFEASTRYYITDSYFRERMPDELAEKQWFFTVRNIARATDERTVICTIIPRAAGCEVTPYIEIEGDAQKSLFLTGVFNSFILDYVARQKVGGTHLSYFILYQLPVFTPKMIQKLPLEFFIQKVLELVYTSYLLQGFASNCGYDGPPFRWDEERRFLLRCELDAAYFHLYGITCEHVDYIMETFPIVKRKDMEKFGEYCTKRVILEIYDAMQKAIETGEPYHTRLDPPPADPQVVHPPRKAEDVRNSSIEGYLVFYHVKIC